MATEEAKVKVGSFVPNSFQTPNAYVDYAMPYLTGEEYKVLSYATRRILGFQKRQDHISLSQFTDGTRSKDGEILDSGTGLSVATVKKCLASLVGCGLMIHVADNNTKFNLGAIWALQWDGEKVNWQALQDRKSVKKEKHAKKMTKARSMRHTPPNGIEDPPGNGIEDTPPNGIETQKTEETQGNPVLIIKEPLDLFKGYFNKFLSSRELERWEVIYEAVGKDQAEKLLAWAFKKEIHLTNRGGLLDSLETAAKNWKEKPAYQPKGNKSNANTSTGYQVPQYTQDDYDIAAQIRAERGLS